MAFAEHRGARADHVADGVERSFGFVLLDDADDGVDDDDRENDGRIDIMAERHRDRRADDHHVDQHVVKLQEEPRQKGFSRADRQGIGAMALQAGRRLGVAEPFARAGEIGDGGFGR